MENLNNNIDNVENTAPKIKAHDKVLHEKFGEGTVKKKTGKSLVVLFEDGEKFFQYPEAFLGGFLQKMK